MRTLCKTFVGLLETRGQFLGGHSKRVATFSRAVSEHYDLNDRVQREIEIGALLHDIGKIGMPDVILNKTQNYFMTSQLSIQELYSVHAHPIIGQEAVEMIERTRRGDLPEAEVDAIALTNLLDKRKELEALQASIGG